MPQERIEELYDTVLDLVREFGYESLTMDTVAARAHMSKATLYRQWEGKAGLVAHALRHGKASAADAVDTGSLRGDLDALIDRFDHVKTEHQTALLRSLIQAAHTHPELLRCLRQSLVEPERDSFGLILRRAVERGEIAADTQAVEYFLHMMIGGVLARELVEERPVDREFLRGYVYAVILPALGA